MARSRNAKQTLQAEVDQLRRAGDTADSPTQPVGTQTLGQFLEVNHRKPMLSLENAFNEEDRVGFDRRVLARLSDARIEASDVEYWAEPKLAAPQ